MNRTIFILLITLAALLFAFTKFQIQAQINDKTARQLSRFERDWLLANLNDDKARTKQIFTEKIAVSPSVQAQVNERNRAIATMLDPALLPSEMKVRISGNIFVLTNSASNDDSRENSESRNRTYHFLDTLNKKNGKWEIVATHFSRIFESNFQNEEQNIKRLEREKSEALIKKDVSSLRQIIADDFVGIESTGTAVDKIKFIGDVETGSEKVQSVSHENIKVRISGDAAIVTGHTNIVRAKENGSQNAQVFFTNVWTKRAGQWQIVNSQATKAQ